MFCFNTINYGLISLIVQLISFLETILPVSAWFGVFVSLTCEKLWWFEVFTNMKTLTSVLFTTFLAQYTVFFIKVTKKSYIEKSGHA